MYLPVEAEESKEVQSGWHSFRRGYIIVVLNPVISSISHFPGAGQMGKHGGSAPGIMLVCIAGAR